jgi:predicted amidohydrolase YtcJ
VLLTSGRIYTLDAGGTVADTLVVRDGRSAFAGRRAAVNPAGEPVRDLGGRAVLPRPVDAHGHLMHLARARLSLDVRGLGSEQEIAARVGQRAAALPRGEWTGGRTWDQNLWPGRAFPTRVARPRGTRSSGGAGPHRRARDLDELRGPRRRGNRPLDPDPPGGLIARDAHGEPTGLLIDAAQRLVQRAEPRPSHAEFDRAVRECIADCLAVNLTGLREMGAELYAGRLSPAGGARPRGPRRRPRDGGRGQAPGRRRPRRSREHPGALACEPRPDHRLRVEHAQILAEQDVPRFRRLGVLPSMQATHCTSDMAWAAERVGPERLQGAYAWRSLLATGVVIAGGSDFPVESPNPFHGIHAAVTRRPRTGNDPGVAARATDDAGRAVRSFTIWNAFASRQERDLGSLEPGKRADLVVLSEDVFTCPQARIAQIRPVLAMIERRRRPRGAGRPGGVAPSSGRVDRHADRPGRGQRATVDRRQPGAASRSRRAGGARPGGGRPGSARRAGRHPRRGLGGCGAGMAGSERAPQAAEFPLDSLAQPAMSGVEGRPEIPRLRAGEAPGGRSTAARPGSASATRDRRSWRLPGPRARGV